MSGTTDPASAWLHLRRATDRRLVALDSLARELVARAGLVVCRAEVSARWRLDPETADLVLAHLVEDGLLGRRDDGKYVAASNPNLS
jgi:hypothetical protein